MAHPKQIDPADILTSAVSMLEEEGPEALSLRAIARQLGVKAPSLYRYFPDKAALERAVIAEGHSQMLHWCRRHLRAADPEKALRQMAAAYIAFARNRPALYFFTMHHAVPAADATAHGKELWNLLLAAVTAVTGIEDDTSGAVALWSFLHGFAVLEHSGRFGKSGPKQAWDRGLAAFTARPDISSAPTGLSRERRDPRAPGPLIPQR